MRGFSLTEPVTIFWYSGLEGMKTRPESRYFEHAQDAVIWAFETLSTDQRWSGSLRLENDHDRVRLSDTESVYQTLKSKPETLG